MGEFKIAMKTLATCENESREFKEVLNVLQQGPLCERLSLASYLLTPVQRLPRYELLLKVSSMYMCFFLLFFSSCSFLLLFLLLFLCSSLFCFFKSFSFNWLVVIDVLWHIFLFWSLSLVGALETHSCRAPRPFLCRGSTGSSSQRVDQAQSVHQVLSDGVFGKQQVRQSEVQPKQQ